jgi:2-keto-4-pentenoate hydratase
MTKSWEDPRVQRGMEKLFAKRRELTAAGDQPVGWKIAFAAPAFQQSLNLNGPLIGFLPKSAARQSGEEISLAGWVKPVAEPEVAVYLGTDLPGGSDRAAAEAAIAKLGPAIEMVDLQQPPTDVEVLLTGNISHRHVVLGPAQAASIDSLTGRAFRRGAEFARTSEVQALTGDIVDLVRYVADYLAGFGERLRAGELVICGSIMPPVPIEADEKEFGFALDPIGEVRARFRHNAGG